MGVELADHIAHRARRLFMLGGGAQTQLAHGINNAPLYGFEAVANMGQSAVENHVHGVIEIGFFGVLADRAAFRRVDGNYCICHKNVFIEFV